MLELFDPFAQLNGLLALGLRCRSGLRSLPRGLLFGSGGQGDVAHPDLLGDRRDRSSRRVQQRYRIPLELGAVAPGTGRRRASRRVLLSHPNILLQLGLERCPVNGGKFKTLPHAPLNLLLISNPVLRVGRVEGGGPDLDQQDLRARQGGNGVSSESGLLGPHRQAVAVAIAEALELGQTHEHLGTDRHPTDELPRALDPNTGSSVGTPELWERVGLKALRECL